MLHAPAKLELDEEGFDLSEYRKRRILWSDISHIEMSESPILFGLDIFSARFHWIRIYFRKEIMFSDRARAIGLFKVRTYLTIPPMHIDGPALKELLETRVAKFGRPGTPAIP